MPHGSGMGCSVFLNAHCTADTFLVEQRGADWADTPVLGYVGLMLAEASSQVLCAEATRRPLRFKRMVAHGPDPEFEAMSVSDSTFGVGGARTARDTCTSLLDGYGAVSLVARVPSVRLPPENGSAFLGNL